MVSQISWTSPRTWVSGEVVTAALLNVHLRDNLLVARYVLTSSSAALSALDGNNNRTITSGVALQDGCTIEAYFIDGFSNRVHLVPSYWNGSTIFFDPDNQSTAGQTFTTGTTVFYKIIVGG